MSRLLEKPNLEPSSKDYHFILSLPLCGVRMENWP